MTEEIKQNKFRNNLKNASKKVGSYHNIITNKTRKLTEDDLKETFKYKSIRNLIGRERKKEENIQIINIDQDFPEELKTNFHNEEFLVCDLGVLDENRMVVMQTERLRKTKEKRKLGLLMELSRMFQFNFIIW